MNIYMGGGGGYSFVACLSHLTTDHASFSRRSTPPTATSYLQYSGAQCASSIYYNKCFCLSYHLPLCRCGRHLSPRIAIAFSRLYNVSNFSMSHPSVFLISVNKRSSLYTLHSSHDVGSSALPKEQVLEPFSFTWLLVYLLLCGRLSSPTRKRTFGVFVWSIAHGSIFLFLSIYVTSVYL